MSRIERTKIRDQTAMAMQCRADGPGENPDGSGGHCHGDMLITQSGMLVCEHGCGRLLHPPDGDGGELTIAQLRAAWPERVIGESAGYREAMKAAG